MFRQFSTFLKRNLSLSVVQRKTFLTDTYKCLESWQAYVASNQRNINLADFYNSLDQEYSSKGVLNPIDVDIFSHSMKDSVYLDELKDLLFKLRSTKETSNTLDSTHHAVIRNLMQFGNTTDLINILGEPLKFGIFMDNFLANILIDTLLSSKKYEEAAKVSSYIMLQEEYNNKITNALCQYACFKYIQNYVHPAPTKSEEKNENVEIIKIRIRYLRNPYFDDHFDIKDTYILAGKTLAWISAQSSENLNNNLQIIGWLVYKKYNKLLALCEKLSHNEEFKVYSEVIDIIQNQCEHIDPDNKQVVEQSLTILKSCPLSEKILEDSLEINIENAINSVQNNDISELQQQYKLWEKIREEKLEEQVKRLDRAKRLQLLQQKQKELQDEEQKLWYFENEDKIELEIERKQKLISKSTDKKSAKKNEEDYIPPEILPQKK